MTNIFKIKREERLPALVALIVFVALNGLLLQYYPNSFFKGGNLGYWSIFYKHFTVSGFDAYSYIFLSSEKIYFEVSRHPLFAVLLLPGFLVNKGLMALFHHNYATYIMAVMLVVSAVYSVVFFFRICRELIVLNKQDSGLLTVLFYSFASIILTVMVPDHFCFSMTCLLATIYIIGRNLQERKSLKAWQMGMLFLVTAGMSLSNGVKTGISALFEKGRKVFSPKYFLVAFVFPLLLMGGAGYYQYVQIVRPQQIRGEKIAQKQLEKHPEIAKKNAIHDQWMKQGKGKAISDKPFLKWTDLQTSRSETIVENLFGEGIQLHQRYLLKDHSVNRPTFVKYDWTLNYVIEGVIVFLFGVGLYYCRKSRWMWMCLWWVVFDMFLHLMLGFGINEVYIMGAHWMFVIPFAIGFILKNANKEWRLSVRICCCVLALYLWAYNGSLIVDHFFR